jgi:indolepyruvate ferredoxin oxidoreductase
MTLTPDADFALDDRYARQEGEVLITGVQALVRAPFDQLKADKRAGLKTTAFFSGYQGSPLGGFDRELLAHQKMMDEYGAILRPALNEELGATAVMGSQVASTFANRTYDGVIGVWYGKGPGVDRAGDAIRHAQFAGTAHHGGVLALCGDDPAAKSSTVPCRTEVVVAAMGLPVFYPGTMQDVLDLSRHGIAMSRACGLWTSIKVVAAVADATGSAIVSAERIQPIIPVFERNGSVWVPEVSGNVGPPAAANREGEVLGIRHDMALAYIVENKLNKMLIEPANAKLTIIAAGYHAEIVIDTLGALGLDLPAAAALGIRILKLGAITPLDVEIVRRSVRDVGTVLVVEDKHPHIETLVRDALYPLAERPVVLGKKDATGAALIGVAGTQTIETLREPLRRVLSAWIDADRLVPAKAASGLHFTLAPEATRTPFFCSGCPHNTGTKAPDDALVGAGIGCHGMVVMMPTTPGRGNLIGLTQMGGEGSQWIGIAPFVTDQHLFQNVGDGTFFHSAQLSVQAAAAAGVNVTFKILYNAAVAMTGGQDATGQLPVPALASKLVAEGVKEIIITTDDTSKYSGVSLPARTTVRHRDHILDAQEHLRTIKGVTILIHDQQCAAEKRRERKRGTQEMPPFRIMIDERVCEGCGDCGVQSNCLSLQPHDTEFGRKTVIDQASCNLDISCIKGDCPAFITVIPSKAKGKGKSSRPKAPLDRLTKPTLVVPAAGATIRMPGIGGTGVVTVAQVLAAAAKIEGVPAHVLDQTGLSQKAGPVVSTIELGTFTPGRVDLLLALDLLVSVNAANLIGLDSNHTLVAGSSTVTPTGRMVGNVSTANVSAEPFMDELAGRTRGALNRYADASGLTIGLLGSAVTANIFVLGLAFQAGGIPLDAASIERAIEINGTAVEANTQAFRWGRLYFLDPAAVEGAAGLTAAVQPDVTGLDDFAADPELQRLVAIRRTELIAYQNQALADRYVGIVRAAFTAEQAGLSLGTRHSPGTSAATAGRATIGDLAVGDAALGIVGSAAAGDSARGDGSEIVAEFSRTVAHQLHRVMAYKDEYEVARLLLDGRERVDAAFGGVDKMTWNLHPPALRAMGMKNKLKLGSWSAPMLVGLRAMKGLRGSALDIPGYAKVRRSERALIGEYIALVENQQKRLTTDPADATRIVGLIDIVRGYEDVKMRNLATYRKALADAVAAQ